MNRRGFFAALVALPFVGKLAPAVPLGATSGMAMSAMLDFQDAKFQLLGDAYDRWYEDTLNAMGVWRAS